MNYDMFDDINFFTNFKGKNNMNKLNNNNLNYYLDYGNQGLDLYTPYEGYIKGNLFRNLYQNYKNYQPAKFKLTSDSEEMLLNIGQISFARHELNLYLDNYPDDQDALNLFNKYSKMELELRKNYEGRYGPLVVSDLNDINVPFKWENNVWPWER